MFSTFPAAVANSNENSNNSNDENKKMVDLIWDRYFQAYFLKLESQTTDAESHLRPKQT